MATPSAVDSLATATASTLAINGGEKAFRGRSGNAEPKIGVEEFFSLAERFGFSQAAIDRLKQAVCNDDLGQGPHLGRYYGSAKPSMGDRFEALAREVFNVKHAYAVCNGTCALTAACAAIGAGPGKELIIPATGFIATSLAGALLGATPVFCDIDESFQIDPEKIEALITPRTIAIMPTHHWGYVADMDPIVAIARKHGLKVIEDCAQSPGATYKGRPVGSIGDIGCFSISSYKLIGGGEGGLAITNDDHLFNRIRQASEAGGLWRSSRFAPPQYDGELFVGGNYRLSELESAINVIQMQKLDGIVNRYRRVWNRIARQLHDYREITWQKSNDPLGDIVYMLRFFPESDELGHKVAAALRAEGLTAGYRGANAEPDWHVARYYFPLFGCYEAQCKAENCPVASDIYNRRISVSLDQWWSDADCDAFAFAMTKVLNALCTTA